MTLYYPALDPLPLPVHQQKRRAQLLLEQLPLLDRVARWYSRKGVDIQPEYTICPCHMHTPETWNHSTKCQLAQDEVHVATWKPEDTITQHAGWGPATPPANEVRHLMGKPEIEEARIAGGAATGDLPTPR